KTDTIASADFREAIRDVVRLISARPVVMNVMSPLAAANSGQISKDGHSALIQFEIRGDHQTADMRIAPVLASAAAAQKAHPDYYIGEFGMASANHALNDTLKQDMQRA